MDQKNLRKKGIITESLPSTHFRVKLEDGEEIYCYLAGKLRKFRIKILPGDKVIVELSPYDTTKGRIVYRER